MRLKESFPAGSAETKNFEQSKKGRNCFGFPGGITFWVDPELSPTLV
jgi:hypothetical protein